MDGYQQKQYGVQTKRYVQTLRLPDDEALIKEYKKWHSEPYHWREVREGIRAVGILEMELYLCGTTAVMIVDTPLDFDWQTAMNRLATLPRQAEWEAFVSRLQGCDPNARSEEKWQIMERFFRLY